MARNRLLKRLICLLLAVGGLVLLAFGGLVAWVVTGPRSLNAFTPYIESALAATDHSYRVKIGGALLSWDGWEHPVGIRTHDVDIVDAQGKVMAHFPDVGVRMYFFELLTGKVDIKSVELINPTVELMQDEKGRLSSMGFKTGESQGSDQSLGVALGLFLSEGGDNPVAHLKSFVIKNALLTLNDKTGKPFLSSPATSVELKRQHGKAEGRLLVPLQFDGKRSQIDMRFMLDASKREATSDLVFSEVPSSILHALAPGQDWMGGVTVPLSGSASMSSDFDANINGLDFRLEAGSGSINLPDQFEKPLALNSMKVRGALTDQLRTLTIKEGEIEFSDHALYFNGVLFRDGEEYGADMHAEIGQIPVDKFGLYWPLKLAPHSRHWVTTRLAKGMVEKANVTLHFKPGEFKLKNTPEAAVDSTIAIKGTTVAYKPSHPPVTDVDGIIKFTGRSMDVKVTSAKYMNETHITGGRVYFPDFYPDDVRLFVEMQVDTTAKDVQRFLSLPDLNKAAKLGLTPEVTGKASGSAKLDLIAFAENPKNEVSTTGKINYTVSATMMSAAQSKFMGKRDISDADMKIALDNKGIKVDGKARVNGLPMTIDLTSSFLTDDTKYMIKTDMPVARLPDFGLPKLDFAKGTIGVNANFTSGDKAADKAEATLDITRVDVAMAQHGFFKKDGERAVLKLTTEDLPSGNTNIPSFALRSDHMSIAGKAEYSKALGDFASFSFSDLRFGRNDMQALAYRNEGKAVRIEGSGKAMDISPYISHSSGSDLGYIINLRTDRLVLGDGKEMYAATVQADCPPDICRSAHIDAKLKDGTPFLYDIANGKLNATCNNAGELSHVLSIMENIEGGKLSMQGEYKDGKLEGVAEVKEYKLKNAPVFTKMFTIASLTGILNTLTGNGIYFDRLNAPFVYHAGILVLKDAKTHGSALGLTADGSIDTNHSTMDINGVLVPSYTINSLLGNVPLIGNLLQGGSGKGLVALSYGMHGEMKDPSIHVNPLSVLTPGFLRNIFKIFDRPEPDIDALAAKSKADAAKAEAAKPDAAKPEVVTPEPAKTVEPTVPLTVPVQQAPAPVQQAPAPAPPLTSTLPSTDELMK